MKTKNGIPQLKPALKMLLYNSSKPAEAYANAIQMIWYWTHFQQLFTKSTASHIQPENEW
jgi:hypothetical protein